MKFKWIYAVAALLLLAALAYLLLLKPEGGGEIEGRRALVVDSLYEWIPNDDLLKFLVKALREKGYNVTLIKGRDATVDAFRNLTLYNLIIIRCHGGYLSPGDTLGGDVLDDYAPVIFTGEPFSECLPLSCKYYRERLSEEVVAGEFEYEGERIRVFALTPIFFRNLDGRFKEGTVMVVASCYGLCGKTLAKTLFGKGLDYFVSWDWKVSPGHMDKGLRMLVEEAVVNGVDWKEAVKLVSGELGPDPWGGGVLKIESSG